MDRVLTIKDLQLLLGIGRTKAYSLIRNGDIESFRIGRDIRISSEAVLAYISKLCYDETTTDECPAALEEVSQCM